MALVLNFIALLKLKYILIALISFLGIFAGVALAFIAPEELRKTKNYLILLRDFLLMMISFLLIKSLFDVYIALPCLILLFPIIYYFRNHQLFDKFTFILLSAVLIASMRFDMAIFAIIATLIFSYGAVISLINIVQFEKKEKIGKRLSFIMFETFKRFVWFLYVVVLFSIILLLA